ncbi:MAG TPA: serine/threonine-protein kinase, partial [Pirellulaceae bacterium]|nr:serine/threonine-protein kinase [Pirellulaceae bacterium]
MLAELLPLEFEIRARAGETPLEIEYCERFPEDRDTVAAAFQEFAAWVQESTLSPLASQDRRASDARRDSDDRRVARVERPDAAPSAGAADSRAVPVVTADGTHLSADDTPSEIGRYRIVRRLGQGGMGVVYLAHDPTLDRQVALKLPFLDPRDPRAAARRFAREARAMAAIHHSNLCPIFDVGEIDGRPFLTMAFIDGQTLAERLVETGRMPPQLAARIVGTLAVAVQTIHEAGIVHRDLKPTNVLVDRRGCLFITDFGLASSEAHDPGLTSSGMLIGSPAYMAPEQIETRDDPVGPQSDVYALGVILYELLCGRRPFDGSGMAILGKVSSGEPPTPPTRFAPLPEPLEAICLRALAFRTGDRHSSAAELAAELQNYLQSAETV